MLKQRPRKGIVYARMHIPSPPVYSLRTGMRIEIGNSLQPVSTEFTWRLDERRQDFGSVYGTAVSSRT